MSVGRNELCPCGSGKKYKACCIGKERSRISKGLVALIIVIACIAAIGLLPSVIGDKAPQTTAAPAPAAAPGTPIPAPPGPPPVGKVWSTEHGHWHDAATSPVQMPIPQQPPAPVTPTPQPPGPVPAGKVWSPEHGHWHDVTPPAPAQ